jgi:hypothetical protein
MDTTTVTHHHSCPTGAIWRRPVQPRTLILALNRVELRLRLRGPFLSVQLGARYEDEQ